MSAACARRPRPQPRPPPGATATPRPTARCCAPSRARGHDVLFLERDVPWYARAPRPARPGLLPPRASIDDLGELERLGERDRARPTRSIVGSYVPDGRRGRRAGRSAPRPGVVAFYDIDTPVTLAQARARRRRISLAGADPRLRPLPLLHRRPDAARARARATARRPRGRSTARSTPTPTGRSTGAAALGPELPRHLQPRPPADARAAAARAGRAARRSCASWSPARSTRPTSPGRANVERIEHVPPAEHPAFYAASRFTLNVTRADMIARRL